MFEKLIQHSVLIYVPPNSYNQPLAFSKQSHCIDKKKGN